MLIITVVVLGLASRKYPEPLPSIISEYSGDILWALMIFFLTGFIFPTYSNYRIASIALLFSFAVELSQLYQAEWINSIRQTRAGGLILGYGFLWSDMICYAAGISIGIMIERIFFQFKFRASDRDKKTGYEKFRQ